MCVGNLNLGLAVRMMVLGIGTIAIVMEFMMFKWCIDELNENVYLGEGGRDS